MSRIDPFTLVFGSMADQTFPEIRADLDAQGLDPDDRDAFVLLRAAGAVLREILPAEAPPEALDSHVALLHHAYRYWAAGRPLFLVDEAALGRAVAGPTTGAAGPRRAYVQVPERRAWAELATGQSHQPLDGFFLARRDERAADLLAIFGLHAARSAFAAVPAQGPWDEPTLREAAARADGSPPFASLLPGGREAGLLSIATAAELLLLARRLVADLAVDSAGGYVPAPD